jgi:hypothetical protein
MDVDVDVDAQGKTRPRRIETLPSISMVASVLMCRRAVTRAV